MTDIDIDIDIVDKLRGFADRLPSAPVHAAMLRDAADEIERLRGQVDSMQMANDMLRATHKTDNQYHLDEIERLRRLSPYNPPTQEDRDRVRRKLTELDDLRAEIERLRGNLGHHQLAGKILGAIHTFGPGFREASGGHLADHIASVLRSYEEPAPEGEGA